MAYTHRLSRGERGGVWGQAEGVLCSVQQLSTTAQNIETQKRLGVRWDDSGLSPARGLEPSYHAQTLLLECLPESL